MESGLFERAHFRIAGDRGLLVEYGDTIDPAVNHKVRSMAIVAKSDMPEGVIEIIPTYRSILMFYDPSVTNPSVLKETMTALEKSLSGIEIPSPKLIEIPVCYGGDFGPDIEYVANKCINLRIFQDKDGKMNRSVLDEKGEILVISQFTLYGDTRKGRRPSFIQAAVSDKGEKYYNYFIDCLKQYKIHVENGVFGAMMDVELINNGPVTLIVESK